MNCYNVYGYYSRNDFGRPGEYLETFETLEEATEYVEEFQRVSDRHAWIESQTDLLRQQRDQMKNMVDNEDESDYLTRVTERTQDEI